MLLMKRSVSVVGMVPSLPDQLVRGTKSLPQFCPSMKLYSVSANVPGIASLKPRLSQAKQGVSEGCLATAGHDRMLIEL
ncbi:MAG: hypothetical protein MZV65_43105, partial [Chromatiales bacterium]|nr:hypothetical protein [Chromatiales bacterium]